MSKQNKEKRPVISFRVSSELKNKIIEVYGDYKPLEHILEDHFLGEITPPSIICDDRKLIKELTKLKDEYSDIYNNNKKMINKLNNQNKKINDILISYDNEIMLINQKDNQIKENIKEININNYDKLTHSINTVTQILEQNKKERELKPTRPIPKKVIKLYSDNCHMSFKKFMEYIPYDLHKCVQK